MLDFVNDPEEIYLSFKPYYETTLQGEESDPHQLNERFGTDFTPADQLFFNQLESAATENEKIRQAAEANTLSNFEPVFNQHLETLLLDRMNGNEAIFNRIINDEAFKTFIAQRLMHNVFNNLNRIISAQ